MRRIDRVVNEEDQRVYYANEDRDFGRLPYSFQKPSDEHTEYIKLEFVSKHEFANAKTCPSSCH